MAFLSKKDYQKIYEILADSTPLPIDCGELCDQICCKQDGEDLGMYLLPGEEAMFEGTESWLVWEKQDPKNYDFPLSWTDTVYFIRCTKECPRNKRPIQCRTFPLTPHLTKKGTLIIIRETLTLPYQCPLITKKTKLQKSFILAVYRAWSLLIQDPRIYDLVEYDSHNRPETLDVVYPSPIDEDILTQEKL